MISRDVADPDQVSTRVLPHHSSRVALISFPDSKILTRQDAVEPEIDNVGRIGVA